MKNYRNALYGAVIYSIIIGAIYVTLSILGLLSRWCTLDTSGGPVVYMLYLLYFRVESCEATVRWNIFSIDNQINVDMPNETDAVARTFIFIIAYLGLHAALIAFSLYALCGVNNSCLGRKSFIIFFVPWLVIWVAIIVLDILATVIYILDTIKVANVDGLMELLQVTNVNAVRQNFEALADHYVYLPPLIMLLTAAKIFIFLIMNAVWIVIITKAGWSASTYHKYLDQTRRNYENTMAGVNPAFENSNDNLSAQKQYDQSSIHDVPPSAAAAESRYNDTTRVQQAFVYSSPQPSNQQNRVQRPNSLILPTQQQQQLPERPPSQQSHQYRNNNNNVNDIDREIESRLSRYQENTGNAVKTVEPLKYEDIPEQQQSNFRIRVLPSTAPPSQMNRSQSEIKQQKPLPPPKPQYNRNSVQVAGNESPVLYRPERINNARVERTSSSMRAPDELRSQLPWSYFKPRDEAPKKAFTHLEEDEELPNVPVPDYTLHYGRKTRSNLSDSNANHQRY